MLVEPFGTCWLSFEQTATCVSHWRIQIIKYLRFEKAFAEGPFGPCKVGQLYRDRLVEQGLALEIGGVWDERGALVRVLVGNVETYGSALVKNKPVVILECSQRRVLLSE